MPIDITFKKYKKGGLIEVYGNINDAIKKIASLLASNGKNSRGIHAYRFMLDTSRGSKEIIVWRGPDYSIIAHNCEVPPEDMEVYKIYYEVFDVDNEGLEYDLSRLKINNIRHKRSEKPPEDLVASEITGTVEEKATSRKESKPVKYRLEDEITNQSLEREPAKDTKSYSDRGAMDVCLIALNKSVEKHCPVSSRDVLEVLDSCGVYFNMSGGSYLCILADFDECKYLVSRIEGLYSRVDCLSSREKLLNILGLNNSAGEENTNGRRARPPLQA
ncbi:MAG: hypothetical protein F7C33_02225 [Desulfurococcales archaeon]|nr:hypothetical protein [Desulfurococcales archaeon]